MATAQGDGWKPMPFKYITRGELLGEAIALPLVCWVLVTLRFYTRRSQKQSLKPDDWLMLPATLMLTGMGLCFIVGYAQGIVGYVTPLPSGTDPEAAARSLINAYEQEAKIEFIFQIFQTIAIALAKISIVWFCRRIFMIHPGSPMDWVAGTFIAVNICWMVGFLLTIVFGCREKVWYHWAPLATEESRRKCGDLRKPELAFVISDVILELAILILPLPSIWRLQISPGKKVGVTAVFAVGIMSLVGSLIRMGTYIVVLNQPYDAGYDLNQTVTTMLWWSMLQAGLAIVAACLPTIYSLRKHEKLGPSLQSLRDNLNRSFSWLTPSSASQSSPGAGYASDEVSAEQASHESKQDPKDRVLLQDFRA